MTDQTEIIAATDLARLIYSFRDQRVILDSDLAGLYGVSTKALNQAVKRNHARFPEEFAFQLSEQEVSHLISLRSQFVTLKPGRGQHRKYRPYAFTEHGALMASTVLNSPKAVVMSIYIIRAFVKMREGLSANAVILKRLAEIDKSLLMHDLALRDIYHKLKPLLEPPPMPPKPEIGFHIKEDGLPYRIKRRSAR